jgi:hypothetical protein
MIHPQWNLKIAGVGVRKTQSQPTDHSAALVPHMIFEEDWLFCWGFCDFHGEAR